MKFLLDENVSYRVAGHLKAAGHEATHVSEIGLTSTDDAVILARARDESQVLVTADHDFVQMLFASGDAALVDGAIASLTLDRVRVRPLPLRPDVGS